METLWTSSAGPMGVMFGIEVRREEMVDDRDPRLDGTMSYVDYENDTYPEIGDVVNSSPTGDVRGREIRFHCLRGSNTSF